mgnify:CR=1 FL=1|tara:strand:+ start:1044 stop:1292 length:249 start_codon:yes stop_codon:yes gene_type:complete
MKKGDLIYIPADVTLMKFNVNLDHINPDQTYIGPAPFKVCQLAKPMRFLLMEDNLMDEKYLKVLFDGSVWHVRKNDITGEIS